MSDNRLTPGRPRLGYLIDGDPHTPRVSVTLEDTGEQVEMVLPWEDHPSAYEHWFSSGIRYADDPDRVKRSYAVPEMLWFYDHDGPIGLVHGRSAGMSMGARGGRGRAVIPVAVLGAEVGKDYRQINGLRTELPGLTDWLDLRCMSVNESRDEAGRLVSLQIELTAPDSVPLTRSLNAVIQPNFRFRTPIPSQTTTIDDTLMVETLVQRPRDWEEHLTMHNSVRELLCIAAWRRFGYTGIWARRNDDPLMTMSDDVVEQRWNEAIVRSLPRHQEEARRRDYLFLFQHIGAVGFRRWLALRSHFERGVTPLLATLQQQGLSRDAAIAMAGIGLDGIGYQLAIDAGVSSRAAKRESHADRLGRVLDQLVALPPRPFDPRDWLQRSSEVYNGVKHANRALPDVLTRANTMRENVLMFRLWVGSRLRVPRRVLTSAVSVDRMTRPYERL